MCTFVLKICYFVPFVSNLTYSFNRLSAYQVLVYAEQILLERS